MPCSVNEDTLAIDQSSFWNSSGLHWDAHRIGWAVAGSCTALTTIISLVTIAQHCRNYTNPNQQRQILRILYMPPIYAIISFFSYRFFRAFTYYSLIQVAYEAVTISAFLLLLIDFVASTASYHSVGMALERKEKSALPIPVRLDDLINSNGQLSQSTPSFAVGNTPYFLYTVKWLVLQFIIIRPAVSIVAIICEKLNVLCQADGYDVHHASVYLNAVDFVSISFALYGLLMFYGLTHEELKGRRPLAKFWAIKLIVMFTFYQSFIFSALEKRVIHGTQFWTATNVADGLNALAICIEMVLFAILMWWAYSPKEYTRKEGSPATSIWKPLWDSINFTDFGVEIIGSLRFFVDYIRGKPATRSHGSRKDFDEAFGITTASQPMPVPQMTPEPLIRSKQDEEAVLLRPYHFTSTEGARSN